MRAMILPALLAVALAGLQACGGDTDQVEPREQQDRAEPEEQQDPGEPRGQDAELRTVVLEIEGMT